jgi:hypothetical protein
MIEFKATKEIIQENAIQIDSINENMKVHTLQIITTSKENHDEFRQTMIEKFDSIKNDTYNWLCEI